MSEGSCLNCATPLLGAYCYKCGQRRQPRIIPVSALVSEAATDYLSLDSGLLPTLRLLITQPGRLTNEYVHGHHAPYVPPFRLYLLISAFYFVIISLTHSAQFFFMSIRGGAAEDTRRLVETMPKLMFVCLPLLALMLKLAFRNRYYVEHLVFALHFSTFAFIALSLHTIAGPAAQAAVTTRHFLPWGIPAIVLDFIAQFAILAYLFISIRRVYRTPKARTILYVAGFLISYMVVMLVLLLVVIKVWKAVT